MKVKAEVDLSELHTDWGDSIDAYIKDVLKDELRSQVRKAINTDPTIKAAIAKKVRELAGKVIDET